VCHPICRSGALLACVLGENPQAVIRSAQPLGGQDIAYITLFAACHSTADQSGPFAAGVKMTASERSHARLLAM